MVLSTFAPAALLHRFRTTLGPTGLLFFLLLVAADVAVLGLAVFYEMGWSQDWNSRLGTERGYAEIVQYIKEYWAALCFAALAWRRRSPVYAALALALTYVLLDDATEIHERGGIALAKHLTLPSSLGLRPQDWGELIVSAVAGVSLLPS